MARLGAAALATLLASAASGASASDDDGCHLPGGSGAARPARMTTVAVTALDAQGRPVDAAVEVDGVAVGRTGHALRVPACSRRLRVSALDRAREEPVDLRNAPFTELRLRLEDPPPAAPQQPAAPDARWPAPAPPPEGMAAVHYHRPRGDYEDWGLHAWHSPDPATNAPGANLPGVDWGSPLPPSGRDSFGVYFLLPVHFFDDGRVNYALHRFSEREQCGDDQSFQLARTREVWVVAGDCRTFHTRREANAAAGRK